MKKLILSFAVALALGCAAQAVPVLSVTPGSFANGASGTIGWSFTTSIDFYVDALGFCDENGDGLGASHQVGIFNSLGELLVSVNVDGSSALVDGFRYSSIPSYLLPAGSYVVGGFLPFANPDRYLISEPFPTGVTTVPGVTFGENRSIFGGLFEAPTTTTPMAGNGRFGPNFSAVPTPELNAASARLPLLMATLLLGLASRRRS